MSLNLQRFNDPVTGKLRVSRPDQLDLHDLRKGLRVLRVHRDSSRGSTLTLTSDPYRRADALGEGWYVDTEYFSKFGKRTIRHSQSLADAGVVPYESSNGPIWNLWNYTTLAPEPEYEIPNGFAVGDIVTHATAREIVYEVVSPKGHRSESVLRPGSEHVPLRTINDRQRETHARGTNLTLIGRTVNG